MAGANYNILVLGDDPRWRRSVQTALRETPEFHDSTVCDVACPVDVSDAVDVAVLAVDPVRTEPSCAATASLVRRFPHARVVLMGCLGRRGVIRDGFRAGAWSCIDDPDDTSELLRSLREADGADTTRPHSAPDPAGSPSSPFEDPHEHRQFLSRLAALRSACQHADRRITLALFDLDAFHSCNERHSLAVGDRALRWFERTLRGTCGSSACVFRDHGDEYIVILPAANESSARELAAHCRRAMLAAPFESEGRTHELTVSVGIVESSAGCLETEHQLLQRARIAVTQAKQFGGNATVSWSELLDTPIHRIRREPFSVDEVSHWMTRMHERVRSTQLESTQALVAAIDARDPYTRLHSLTVSLYADWIGRRMDLPIALLDTLRAASLLHDVGKIGVPDAILTKAGPLTDDEFAIVRRHPEIALDILSGVSFLNDERPLILHHHERFDGNGYPTRLAGDAIPIGARILAVADALDTMFTPRTYKRAYGAARVKAELVAGRGRQFDPTVTDVALDILTEEPELFPGPSGVAAIVATGAGDVRP